MRFSFGGYVLRSGIAGSGGHSVLCRGGAAKLISPVTVSSYIPTSTYKGSDFSELSRVLVFSSLLVRFGHPCGCELIATGISL